MVLDEPDARAVGRGSGLLHQPHILVHLYVMPQPSLCGQSSPPCRAKVSSGNCTVVGRQLERATNSHMRGPAGV
jgi:hypothetical protein